MVMEREQWAVMETEGTVGGDGEGTVDGDGEGTVGGDGEGTVRSDGEGIVGGDGDRVNSGWGTVGGAMACDRNGGDTCDSARWLVTEVVPVMEMACEMQGTCSYNGVVCDR